MSDNKPELTEAMKGAAAASASRDEDGDEISLIDLAATLWRRKWLIVGVTCVAAVFSVIYALMQPNMFTASSTLLPISGSSSSALSQYAGLASMAGVSLPGAAASDPTVKIEAILKSRGFAEKLIDEMNLIPILIKHPEKIKTGTPLGIAVESLHGMFSISTDAKTSLMKVTAKTKDPKLSRDIANKAVDLLQANLQARVLSASGKNIVLMEQQAKEQEQKVRALQSKLAAYQRKNNLVSPQAQSTGSLQLYQSLIQQKIAMEIEISRLESALSDENPKLISAKSKLEAVKQQMTDFERTGGGVGPSMSNTPGTLMEYANLTAELELTTKIYGGLLSSLENLRLQEASEKLFVEVIDSAVAPEKKSEPSRSMICVVGTMAGGFLSVLLAFVLDAMRKLLADPEVRAKFVGTKKIALRRKPATRKLIGK